MSHTNINYPSARRLEECQLHPSSHLELTSQGSPRLVMAVWAATGQELLACSLLTDRPSDVLPRAQPHSAAPRPMLACLAAALHTCDMRFCAKDWAGMRGPSSARPPGRMRDGCENR